MAKSRLFANYAIVLQVVIVYVAHSSSGDYGHCKQKTPCLCEYDDGQHAVDLTKLLPDETFISAADTTGGNYTYYFHGCRNSLFTSKTNSTNDACNKQHLTLCLYNRTSESYTLIGNESNAKFTEDDHKQLEFLYQGNVAFTTKVTLVCTPEAYETELMIHSIGGTEHQLHVFSPHTCKITEPHGMSTGSKLLLIFFIFFTIYLVGGGCLNYFLRGARGREIIPNIDFWTGLPGLIKDGVIFIMNGCRPTMISTAETYDQI